MNIVGVTSCIAGLAHTPMAAKSLEKEGRVSGIGSILSSRGAGHYGPPFRAGYCRR